MRFLPLLLITLLSVTFSSAQTTKVLTRNIYLYTFDYHKDVRNVLLPKAEGGFHDVKLSTANIYGSFETITTEDKKVFLCANIPFPEEGQKGAPFSRPIIAEVTIPSSIKEPLLILTPNNKGGMKYKALVIERGLSDFPKGTYKMINFSKHHIRGKIGESTIKVKPWKMTSFKATQGTEKRFQVIFQFQDNERWQTFGATTWRNNPEKRALLCAYRSPDTGVVKIRSIRVKEPIVVTNPTKAPSTSQ